MSKFDEPIVTVPSVEVEAIRQNLQAWHLFETYDTTLDYPMRGAFRLRGKLLYDMDDEDGFDRMRGLFEAHGFTPQLRHESGRIALYGQPFVIEPQREGWVLNLALFLATIVTTLMAGALNDETFTTLLSQASESEQFISLFLGNLWRGWPFCLSIMLILGAHELGHYFAARYHKVPASLPYFIPMPISIIGTMGAFILQRGVSKNVRTQFDIGASGPLAGMVFAIPILIYGLWTSNVEPLPTAGGYIMEGNSILYAAVKYMVLGEFLPAGGRDVMLNQVAWAGWVGLLVTGLNLIPVGQLDGGRVAQVLLGEEFLRQIYWPLLICLVLLGIFTSTTTWFVWVVLLYFFGRRYERPLDEVMELDDRRRALAIFTLVLFFLVFTPIPLQTVVP